MLMGLIGNPAPNLTGYDADTVAWANQVVTNGGSAPSATSKGYINTLILALKANLGPNLNSVLDRAWPLANADDNLVASVTSIVNPTATAAVIATGTWTSQSLGFQSTGGTAGGYINTNFVPVTASNFQPNAAACGAYCLTSRATSAALFAMGVADNLVNSDNFAYLNYYSAQGNNANDNTSGFTWGSTLVNAKGMMNLTRIGSASTAGYTFQYATSSTPVITQSASVTVTGKVPGVPLYVCTRNIGTTGADTRSTDKFAFAFVGGALSTAQSNNLAAAINAYMTSLGINVY